MSGLAEHGGRFLKKSDTKCTCRGEERMGKGEEVSFVDIFKTQKLEKKHARDTEEVRAGLETVIIYVQTGLCTAVK